MFITFLYYAILQIGVRKSKNVLRKNVSNYFFLHFRIFIKVKDSITLSICF